MQLPNGRNERTTIMWMKPPTNLTALTLQ
jgi:hypothetical protein